MELLTYSSNEDSPLNEARRQYWSDRYMLGLATSEPDRYDVKFWLGQQSPSRSNLAKVARELRAKLQPKKVYRVALAASVTEFVVHIRTHSWKAAKEEAMELYGKHFAVVSVDEVAE